MIIVLVKGEESKKYNLKNLLKSNQWLFPYTRSTMDLHHFIFT